MPPWPKNSQDLVSGDPRCSTGSTGRRWPRSAWDAFIRHCVLQLGRQRKRGVNLEQPRQRLSQIGEIDDVILGQGRLAPDLAEDDFLIDQLDQGLGLGARSAGYRSRSS